MELRRCGTCKKNKSPDLFNWKNPALLLRHSVCKECHVAYRRKHYLANREKYIAKARQWNGDQRLKLQDFIFTHLISHPCVDCGESDPVVLDFDHGAEKFKNIAEMLQNCYSVSSVSAEIKKCEVRCANCHRRKTSKDFGHWKELRKGV